MGPPGLEHACYSAFYKVCGGTPCAQAVTPDAFGRLRPTPLLGGERSARPVRRRNPEVGADLACQPEVNLAVAWDGARTLGVGAPEAVLPPSRNNRIP